MSDSNSVQQHSLIRSLFLHISPGILVTLAFVLAVPFIQKIGYPPLLAFLLAILLIGIPFMLVVMFIEGKRINGRFSLEGVVLYRQKLSWKTFLIIFAAAFVIIYLLVMLVTPVSDYLAKRIFSSLPKWIFLEEQTQYNAYPRNTLLVVFSLQLIMTGVILPWVEERYFRGYLLPRISRYGKWTPLLGGLLFGLYHVWQLYAFPTVFLLGTALGYVVWWKKDIRLSTSLHVVANTVSRLMFLMAALTM